MTDLCDEPNAQEQVELHIKKAVETCPENPEALHALASYKRIIGMEDEAKEAAEKCMLALRPLLSPSVLAEKDVFSQSTSGLPPRALRAAVSRTLADLGMIDDAIDVLESLVDEDEVDVEIWLLLGWCHVINKEMDEAKDCCTKAQQLRDEATKRGHADFDCEAANCGIEALVSEIQNNSSSDNQTTTHQ
eukprot:GHVO01052609.1.p1 GENE.GHVO01052609.1~~GHVO01052609.1.p1  ORF type:complete len:190 (-),score=35.23 GHVO01052609.1:53-622(-)